MRQLQARAAAVRRHRRPGVSTITMDRRMRSDDVQLALAMRLKWHPDSAINATSRRTVFFADYRIDGSYPISAALATTASHTVIVNSQGQNL